MRMRKPGISRNSAIPYADRLLMAKHDSIAAHRNDSARTALMIACLALNHTEGFGKKRIQRFAEELQRLCNEYYGEEQELAEARLAGALEQLGFKITDDGRMLLLIPEGVDV